MTLFVFFTLNWNFILWKFLMNQLCIETDGNMLFTGDNIFFLVNQIIIISVYNYISACSVSYSILQFCPVSLKWTGPIENTKIQGLGRIWLWSQFLRMMTVSAWQNKKPVCCDLLTNDVIAGLTRRLLSAFHWELPHVRNMCMFRHTWTTCTMCTTWTTWTTSTKRLDPSGWLQLFV